MMESMQKSMTVMEEKVSVALTKIEDRLDSLETKANSCTLVSSTFKFIHDAEYNFNIDY